VSRDLPVGGERDRRAEWDLGGFRPKKTRVDDNKRFGYQGGRKRCLAGPVTAITPHPSTMERGGLFCGRKKARQGSTAGSGVGKRPLERWCKKQDSEKAKTFGHVALYEIESRRADRM